jgi:hypothetical protein
MDYILNFYSVFFLNYINPLMRLFGRAFLLEYICYETKLYAVFDTDLLFVMLSLWVISAANVNQNVPFQSAFDILSN